MVAQSILQGVSNCMELMANRLASNLLLHPQAIIRYLDTLILVVARVLARIKGRHTKAAMSRVRLVN